MRCSGPALPNPLRHRAEPWRDARPRAVGWAIAAALVAQTGLLRQLGPFDSGAFLFYEDLDLCLRAAERGIPTVLHPEVVLRPTEAPTPQPRRLAVSPMSCSPDGAGRWWGSAWAGGACAWMTRAQALTFATRAGARLLMLRSPHRPLAQLRALRRARRRQALSSEPDTISP